MNDFSWDQARVLAAVAEAGSLTAAARALGSSQPTVGRQIAELEARLGTALILRSPRGVALTEAGVKVAAAAARMASEARRLCRDLSLTEGGLQGAVRVGASEIVGMHILLPLFAELRRQHPDIIVDLVLNNAPEDLLGGDVDIAVRLFRPTQLDLVARSVGVIRFGLFASAAYILAQGPFPTLESVMDGHLIGYDRDPWLAAAWAEFDPRLRRDLFVFRTDHQLSHIAAASAGLGVAPIQLGIGQGDERLTQILPDLALPQLPVWLVMPGDLRTVAVVRAVYSALSEGLEAAFMTEPGSDG